MNNAYHLYSHGNNVIFRKESDYVSVSNKIAVCCHVNGAALLAFSIMSTHVHLLIEAADEECAVELAAQIVKNYSISYKSSYGHGLDRNFIFSHKAMDGHLSCHQELLYVMRNPVHHLVSMTPFGYRFSSGAYLFQKELTLSPMSEIYLGSCTKVANLTQRARQKVVGRHDVPGGWLVTPDGMLLPTSYLNLNRIEAFWNGNVKSFLVDMNRNIPDSNHIVRKADTLDISISQYTDIEVCGMIDDFAEENGLTSFHHLDNSQTARIRNILMCKGVNNAQIARCLWLDT